MVNKKKEKRKFTMINKRLHIFGLHNEIKKMIIPRKVASTNTPSIFRRPVIKCMTKNDLMTNEMYVIIPI